MVYSMRSCLELFSWGGGCSVATVPGSCMILGSWAEKPQPQSVGGLFDPLQDWGRGAYPQLHSTDHHFLQSFFLNLKNSSFLRVDSCKVFFPSWVLTLPEFHLYSLKSWGMNNWLHRLSWPPTTSVSTGGILQLAKVKNEGSKLQNHNIHIESFCCCSMKISKLIFFLESHRIITKGQGDLLRSFSHSGSIAKHPLYRPLQLSFQNETSFGVCCPSESNGFYMLHSVTGCGDKCLFLKLLSVFGSSTLLLVDRTESEVSITKPLGFLQ